ncbi:DEKNAAC101272 [Brettanomyces naardenensis]|uniref:DEKNAAC101272 n=1 Tax=Brettanomyces naardenensis TaxID=13370 RepID=A0A448YHP4_BRENA|nr:DEKNAAC101272 [Brettanomyces naardenensis]
MSEPRGILKNAPEDATYKREPRNELDPEKSKFDRQKVIENTRMNSKLAGLNAEQGNIIRQRLAHQAKIRDSQIADEAAFALDDDHLKWDEKNIILNEQEKSATMKIDEPKTPYEGGFNPNNEYYRPDEDDTTGEDELGDINLGEGVADDKNVVPNETIEVVESEQPEPALEEESEEKELSPAEKHKLFELKRKQHYHMKGNVLKHPLPEPDDDDKD